MEIEEVSRIAEKLRDHMKTVISGKDDVIDKVILCLFSGGHILLEDIPGTGKTTLAKALARSVQCMFRRVQFTPDLLPSDLTGINFYNQKLGDFVFKRGAIFTQILLGDEINRATPRTQSSLLECMEERQITVDGVTYALEEPFLVIATQNPIEIQGTFPLPEAQLDRFLMRLKMGYPAPEDERDMLTRFAAGSPLVQLEPAARAQEIVEAQIAVKSVAVGEAVKEYIVRIAQSTRAQEKIRLGVSPRGCLALLRAAQAHAACASRSFVTPDDVKAVCADVLSHRILLKGFATAQETDELLRQILVLVPVPTEEV